MVSVKSNLFPYRMVLKRREPVQLSVQVKNDSGEEKLVSLEVLLPRELGLDKGGLKSKEVVKIGKLLPNQEKILYFDIFPKSTTSKMEYPVNVTLLEHYKDFNYVNSRHSKELQLRVDD